MKSLTFSLSWLFGLLMLFATPWALANDVGDETGGDCTVCVPDPPADPPPGDLCAQYGYGCPGDPSPTDPCALYGYGCPGDPSPTDPCALYGYGCAGDPTPSIPESGAVPMFLVGLLVVGTRHRIWRVWRKSLKEPQAFALSGQAH